MSATTSSGATPYGRCGSCGEPLPPTSAAAHSCAITPGYYASQAGQARSIVEPLPSSGAKPLSDEEIEALRRTMAGRQSDGIYGRILATIDSLRREREALSTMIQRFARHRADCEFLGVGDSLARQRRACTCGYSDALAALDAVRKSR